MTNRLLRALFARPEAWSWIDLRPGQWFGGVEAAPDSRYDLDAVAV